MKVTNLKIYHLLTALEKISRKALIALTLFTTFSLGVVDYITGFELSFSFFYLIPVTMTAWAIGRNAGLASSVLCATVWLISNLLSGQTLLNLFVGVWNTLILFGFYAIVAILLTELRQSLEEEQLLSNIDPLTGAMNRRSFNDIAEKKMIVSEVNRRPYTVAYIDLDHLKTINDEHGHATGDLVLKTVVDTIRKQIRNRDLLARLGGDEFAILLTDMDEADAKRIVPRLQLALLKQMKTNEWEITFSIGVLTFLTMPASADSMVSLADALMYEVKTDGRNAIKYSTYD
jgi:diguanylate cyclase (GGDEF)-like protein